MKCPICNERAITSELESAMQACSECARTVGLAPMPPVTRPQKACTCGGRKFLRAIPREHAGNFEVDPNVQTSSPMRLTHVVRRQENVVLPNNAQPIDITEGFGSLEIYACYACGKVEWFCPDVAAVPIHPHLMTDVVDYDAGGPYR